MFINEYYSNIDLKLSPSIDIKLSDIYFEHEKSEDYLIADFLLSSDTISNSMWGGSMIDSTICNLEHINSGRVDSKKFIINQVSGSTYCYNLSGTTFNGGFYQGYYKAEGYDYQVLPNRYIDGVSFEFLIKKQDLDNTCDDKFRLNDVYPDNSGLFFYYGLKQENPYCSRIVSGESCENIPFKQDYSDITIYPWQTENPFLYYTDSNICDEFINYKYEYADCCEDIAQNAFGVRVTEDGKFNIRFLDYSGDCISGYTENNLILKDYISSQSHIGENETHHVVLKFDNISYDDECDLYKDRGLMELSIWVDGQMVMCEKVPELYAYGSEMHKSLQVGIPYNISIGGGTLANIENEYPIADYNETGCTHTFCFSEDSGLFIGYKLVGEDEVFFEGVEYEFIENKMNNLFSSDIEVYKEGKDCQVIKGEINHHKRIEKLIFEKFEVPLKITKCYEITSYPPCDVLEEHFAGSFIGEIDLFKIYNKALSVQQIRNLASNYVNIPILCC